MSGIWFPGGAEVLPRPARFSPFPRQPYRRAILDSRRFCQRSRWRATVDSARQLMLEREAPRRLAASPIAVWKQALNWFFEAARQQPLNALGFLLREAWAKPLADFSDFTRARKRLNIPVVLTREECQHLFAALDGTMRLMAELMYGSGRRLTEWPGLRVKDVDLERRQLIGRAGKGAADTKR